MSLIYICYRRADSAASAARLADDLARDFGKADVFIDFDALVPGIDFEQAISTRLEGIAVMLVVVGPRWLELLQNHQAAANETDYVVEELSAALARGVAIVPVLVEGANLPDAARLPLELRSLTKRQTSVLSHSAWKADYARLRAAMEQLVPTLPSPKTAIIRCGLGWFLAFVLYRFASADHTESALIPAVIGACCGLATIYALQALRVTTDRPGLAVMLLGWTAAFYVFAALPNSYFSDYTDWDDRWFSALPMSLKGTIGGLSTALGIKVTAPEVPWDRLARVVGIWALSLGLVAWFYQLFGTNAPIAGFLDDFAEGEATALLVHGAWMGLFYGLAAAGAMAAMIKQLQGKLRRHQWATVPGSGR